MQDQNPNLHLKNYFHRFELHLIRLLLEYGANINSRDRRGDTALIVAIRSNETNIVQLLIQHGADPSVPDLFPSVPPGGKTLIWLDGILPEWRLVWFCYADCPAWVYK
jgi:hypothetical protein